MPAPEIVTEAVVIGRENRGESFIAYRLMSLKAGLIWALLRRSKKPNAGIAVDLFDEGEFHLERKPGSATGFIKDAKITRRRTKLSRNYSAFLAASKFANLLASNPVHEENALLSMKLLHQGLSAWEDGASPSATYLKCLYLYCRQEGYPVKEEWAQCLPPEERSAVVRTLNRPLAELADNSDVLNPAIQSLETYIRRHTHIRLAPSDA